MNSIPLKINFQDERGTIVDMLENENINAVTLITFSKGAVRGNHFHKKTTQYNYVTKGKIKLVTQVDGEEVKTTILNSGDFCVTPPMEKHALVGIEEGSELMVFTRGPRGGKEYESDTFRLDIPLTTN